VEVVVHLVDLVQELVALADLAEEAQLAQAADLRQDHLSPAPLE
jgi:hypothetical protein